MGDPKAVLFERCPLCGEGTIDVVTHRVFFISSSKILPCPICSATFIAKTKDRYQLAYCVPSKVVERRRSIHKCRDRVYCGCYLGATLHRSDWKKIAEGGESSAFENFLKASELFQSGSLPTCSSEGFPFSLEKGEVIHYVSSPVHVNDQQPSHGETADKCDLVLTNRRIILMLEIDTFDIPFENIEELKEATPGFFIRERGSFEPQYFFPPPYDPVFAAIKGAIHKFRKDRGST